MDQLTITIKRIGKNWLAFHDDGGSLARGTPNQVMAAIKLRCLILMGPLPKKKKQKAVVRTRR